MRNIAFAIIAVLVFSITASASHPLITDDPDTLGMGNYQVEVTGEYSAEGGDRETEAGIELKWKFYEHNEYSLAIKPGVTLATGDEDKGFGEGKPAYSVVIIGAKAIGEAEIYMNIGYVINRIELRDMWNYSLAGIYGISEHLTLVVNAGGETNPDMASNDHPLFILGGLIYSLSRSLDIDAGIKAGLTEAENDYSFLAGMTLKFGRTQ
ncbi:MAG: transporter [Nitrospira sp.]|nr:transporter [bacterium]MBL7048694.1 transporter [Nitrospira sp.]